jgi:hypothetical protein
VQFHGEDRVELTVVYDESDYRRIASELVRRSRWQRLILLPLPIGAGVSLAAEQMIGVVALLTPLLILTILSLVMRRRSVTKLPDWAFSPATFRFGSEGVEVESPAARRLVRWLAISGWRKTPAAYWFDVPGSVPVALPRRTLTTMDEAALERFLTLREGSTPVPAPATETTPAVAPVRAASPES